MNVKGPIKHVRLGINLQMAFDYYGLNVRNRVITFYNSIDSYSLCLLLLHCYFFVITTLEHDP